MAPVHSSRSRCPEKQTCTRTDDPAFGDVRHVDEHDAGDQAVVGRQRRTRGEWTNYNLAEGIVPAPDEFGEQSYVE